MLKKKKSLFEKIKKPLQEVNEKILCMRGQPLVLNVELKVFGALYSPSEVYSYIKIDWIFKIVILRK